MLIECKDDTSSRSIYFPLPLDDGYKVSFNETSNEDKVFYNGIECPIPNVYPASEEQDSGNQKENFSIIKHTIIIFSGAPKEIIR